MTTTTDEEPQGWRRFVPPWWTLGFPLLATIGLAAWRAASAAEGESTATVFVTSLVWPGIIAFAVVALMVVLGWVLDID
jgi:hypothetical protein